MKFFWYIVAFLGIGVGLYPVLYLLVDMQQNGLLASKGELLSSTGYMIAFYMHIFGGGVALLIGWAQFNSSWRSKFPKIHRRIGIIYLIAILLIGAPGGIYIAFFANGAITGKMGFLLLGIFWGAFTATAFAKAKQGDYQAHKIWMIRSYALTFAAVTLRIWLPLFTAGLGYPFPEAYPMIAWLCWVPNMMFAELIIGKRWVSG